MSKQLLRDSLSVRRLLDVNLSELKDDVIAINRVTKVVKGGKNLSFSALVVVGDPGAKIVADRAKAAGVTKVVFDRGGYKYHGRVKALADAAREAGLQF